MIHLKLKEGFIHVHCKPSLWTEEGRNWDKVKEGSLGDQGQGMRPTYFNFLQIGLNLYTVALILLWQCTSKVIIFMYNVLTMYTYSQLVIICTGSTSRSVVSKFQTCFLVATSQTMIKPLMSPMATNLES